MTSDDDSIAEKLDRIIEQTTVVHQHIYTPQPPVPVYHPYPSVPGVTR